jgi:REP element-mobilizing transposase RayT
MPLPIVIAYHLIWTGYGWWLPNDVRGSTSRNIATDILKDLGELHFGRKRIQPARRELLTFFDKAHALLDHEPLVFNEKDVDAIAQGFRIAIAQQKYTCYACVIMPDHIHILIRKHKHQAEEMIAHLQRESHLALRDSGLVNHEHPVWGGHGWKVFLDEPDDIRRTIRYIEKNPIPLKMPVQKWDFVKAYDGWPLHPGHSPNSPYARRLREQNRAG